MTSAPHFNTFDTPNPPPPRLLSLSEQPLVYNSSHLGQLGVPTVVPTLPTSMSTSSSSVPQFDPQKWELPWHFFVLLWERGYVKNWGHRTCAAILLTRVSHTIDLYLTEFL
ncbi:hypothetical protein Pelo_18081 [Pelomyxa schiedti]|nr:hypothetical protein Pelo_18081 [Pelomyxa schiedti]